LNKFRLSGLFTLEERSYYIIGELLYICLDEVVKDKDYQSAKNCMNIAQTLYKTANEPNKPRIFLQNLLESHSIWKSQDFWEEFIKCKTYLYINLDRCNKRRDASPKEL
jgi:predicted metalloprotease with PDZ domain